MVNWSLKKQIQRPIGLDIGHNWVKMIQLSIDNGQIGVVAADKILIAPEINGDGERRRDFVVSAIKELLARGSFSGKDVVSCLPNDGLKITSLRVSGEQSEDIEKILMKEASHRFGLDPETDTINYLVAGEVQQGAEVKNELILFAADNETIKSHIEMLEDMQLRPAAIDTVPCALFRSFGRSLRREEDRDRTVVFVDVGSRFTTVVFGRKEQICFVKQISVGGDNFDRQIASKLGISIDQARILRRKLRSERLSNSSDTESVTQMTESAPEQVGLDASTRQVMVDAISSVAEELAKEISLCFRYYTVTFRGKRGERAVFSGGEAYEQILLNVLKRQLSVEIEVAQPMRGFNMVNVNFDSDKRGLLCEWAVAVGLALKGWEDINSGTGDYERN